MPRGEPRNVLAVRVTDAVRDAARRRAEAEGTTLSEVCQYALRRYGEGAVNNVMPPPTQGGR